MQFIGEWFRRLGFLLRRGAREEELRREMEAHRAELGEPSTFGDMLRLREQAGDAWGWRWLDELTRDIRFAWRTHRQSPGFALTAVVTLALGIGVNSGMFSVVNGLLLRPLYAGADEVVEVDSRLDGPEGGGRNFSYPNYRDLRDNTTAIFANLAAVAMDFAGVDNGVRPRSAFAAAVTANYFEVFGVSPVAGRTFTAEEEQPGAGIQVAILSHQLWRQSGGTGNQVGQQIRINGEPFTVVGVAPDGFSGTSIPGPEVWVPLGAYDAFSRGKAERVTLTARDAHALDVVGRLQPDAVMETAEAAVAAAGQALARSFPSINAGYRLSLSEPSARLMFMPTAGGAEFAGLAVLLMLMPAVVLLVTCLNLADLLLARGHVRRRELAVRSSLGGGRLRLIRQLLTEGLVLAVAGAVLGVVFSTWATGVLMNSLRSVLPVGVSLPVVGFDWRVLAGTAGITIVATLIFGAGPALALTRRAAAIDLKRQPGDDLHGSGGFRTGNALVIVQIALSILLLASGGLFVVSAIGAASADPGFRLDGKVIVEVDPGLAGDGEEPGRRAHLALLDRMRAIPGIEAVTMASRLAFSGGGESRVVLAAGAADTGAPRVDAAFSVIGRDYARVLGLPMLAGRDFTDREVASGAGEQVAIIDDVLARQLWPGEVAVGRLIGFADPDGHAGGQPRRVVGVMPAVRHSPGNPQPTAHVYVPLGQHYASAMTLVLDAAAGQDEKRLVDTVARIVREVDGRVPPIAVATWREHLRAGLDIWVYRAGAGVFSAFGAIALLLAVLGVYGVKSYIVSRRAREFGVRIALGAHPNALLWQVLREGSRVTAIGIGIGLVLAVGAGQFLQGILYGVKSSAPAVLVATPLILLAASLLASYLPALRATKVDPTVALRAE